METDTIERFAIMLAVNGRQTQDMRKLGLRQSSKEGDKKVSLGVRSRRSGPYSSPTGVTLSFDVAPPNFTLGQTRAYVTPLIQ